MTMMKTRSSCSGLVFVVIVGTTLWTATPCVANKSFGGGGGGGGVSFAAGTNIPSFRKSSLFLASSTGGVTANSLSSSSSSILTLLRGGGGGSGSDKKTSTKKATKPTRTATHVTNNNNNNNNKKKTTTKPTPCAGDDNVVVAVKTAASVVLQTLGLLAALKIAEVAPRAFPKEAALPELFGGLPLLQFLASIFVIFSSSTVKCWIQGGVVGAATNQVLKPSVVPGDISWYQNLKKPWFNPPGWVFPIMWLLISKPTQLVALVRILKLSSSSSNEDGHYWPQLTLYCAHLSLGDAWNDVFFGCQRIGLGAYVISTFFAMLLASARLFYLVDPAAGMFMLPTCAWVTVATLLNLRFYQLNM